MEPILAPNYYVVDSFSLCLEKLIKNDVYRITFALLYIYVCVLGYTTCVLGYTVHLHMCPRLYCTSTYVSSVILYICTCVLGYTIHLHVSSVILYICTCPRLYYTSAHVSSVRNLVSLVISLPRPFPYNLLCEFTCLSGLVDMSSLCA